MIPFMALVTFLPKCRAIFSFLMDSSQSTKLTFMLLARPLSSIESIAMLLFGFLLLCINTGNILSIALSTPHVSHLPCDILRLTCFFASGPTFCWWLFQSTFCCQWFGLCAARFSRQMWFQIRIPWLSHAVSPRMHLWFHQHVASFSKINTSHDAYSSLE